MLLTLSTTHVPATDLGFLLHKHPDRPHEASLPFGQALVVYPEASPSAALRPCWSTSTRWVWYGAATVGREGATRRCISTSTTVRTQPRASCR